MNDQSPIPPEEQAKQIPTPVGLLPRTLISIFGPSYRTSLAGIGTAISVLAGSVIALCPKLLEGHIDRHEITVLVVTLIASGGLAQMGISGKDKSVTGVEK